MLMGVKERLSQSWERMYGYAKAYYEHYSDLEVPARFKTNDGYTSDENGKITLGYWISTQRTNEKNSKLESSKKELLLKIGMRFENKINNMSWEEMYKYAKIYYEHHGNLGVPQTFKTNDGYTFDENGKITLGYWINTQRTNEKNGKLESSKKELLLKIGMRFESLWEVMYGYAKIYYEHHGNLEVPAKFKTNDGYTRDDEGKALGQWISNQRVNEKNSKLESYKKDLLLKIGMRFENKINNMSWEEMYKYAKIYYDHYGNLEVPRSFKTSDGYTRDDEGKALGQWISNQRVNEKNSKLESYKKDLLLKVGMRFENKINNMSWEEMYKYAKIYYDHYGNLEVPAKFKTNDGYTRDDEGISLGSWINTQRTNEKNGKLELSKKELLLKIGMRFENKINNMSWEKMYEYAKIYYEHHGDLKVPQKFKTNNGYTRDDDGDINLGDWIWNQKRNKKLEVFKIQLLNSIGMIWDAKENKEKIENICVEYDIDIKINKSILEHISIQELSSKISYLLNNNISIVDSEGKLHEIFSMSNINMQAKYNVSLEDLVNKYYIVDTESRGK